MFGSQIQRAMQEILGKAARHKKLSISPSSLPNQGFFQFQVSHGQHWCTKESGTFVSWSSTSAPESGGNRNVMTSCHIQCSIAVEESFYRLCMHLPQSCHGGYMGILFQGLCRHQLSHSGEAPSFPSSLSQTPVSLTAMPVAAV